MPSNLPVASLPLNSNRLINFDKFLKLFKRLFLYYSLTDLKFLNIRNWSSFIAVGWQVLITQGAARWQRGLVNRCMKKSNHTLNTWAQTRLFRQWQNALPSRPTFLVSCLNLCFWHSAINVSRQGKIDDGVDWQVCSACVNVLLKNLFHTW